EEAADLAVVLAGLDEEEVGDDARGDFHRPRDDHGAFGDIASREEGAAGGEPEDGRQETGDKDAERGWRQAERRKSAEGGVLSAERRKGAEDRTRTVGRSRRGGGRAMTGGIHMRGRGRAR